MFRRWYLGIAERWVEAEKIFKKWNYWTSIFSKQEGQEKVIRSKRLDHNSKEHNCIADSVWRLHGGCECGNEVWKHLHCQHKGVEEEEDDDIEGCVSEEPKSEGKTWQISRNRCYQRVYIRYDEPRGPIGRMTRSKDVQTYITNIIPCLNLYYFSLTISFWMNKNANRGVIM